MALDISKYKIAKPTKALDLSRYELTLEKQESALLKLGKGIYKYSGAKSYMDWVFLPSKVLETKIEIETAKGLSESRKGLADLTTKLVKQWRAEKNPTRKEKLQGIISDNFKQMGIVFEQEKESESRMLTQKQVAGTTLKAGATAALLGKHPTGATRVIGSGLIGMVGGAGRALEEGKDEKAIAKQALTTGAMTSAISMAFEGVVKGLDWIGKTTEKQFQETAVSKSREIVIPETGTIAEKVASAKAGVLKEVEDEFGAKIMSGIKVFRPDFVDGILLGLARGNPALAGVAYVSKTALKVLEKSARARGFFAKAARNIAGVLQRVPESQKAEVARGLLNLLSQEVVDMFSED